MEKNKDGFFGDGVEFWIGRIVPFKEQRELVSGGSWGCPGPGGGGSGWGGPPSCAENPANPSAGCANTGGGGGGNSSPNPPGISRGTGGSGVVIVIEPAGTKTVTSSGVFSMEEQYDYALAGEW